MTLYAIGDIQGCSREFDALLAKIGFHPGRDRLWLAGDLVNRGPDSLGVLRRVIGLGPAVTTVLGNHDLHLLAAAAGVREPSRQDTFQDVLGAPDRDALLDWLRRRPLLHRTPDSRRALAHAGIPPAWSLERAAIEAGAVETALAGDRWQQALATMYGSEPRAWSDTLDAEARRRFAINALTRMRYVTAGGQLDLSESGPPGTQAQGLVPWFDVPGRRTQNVHIVFGHWAALGVLRRADVTALDSGCVWGGALTAVAIDPAGETYSIDCAEAAAIRSPAR